MIARHDIYQALDAQRRQRRLCRARGALQVLGLILLAGLALALLALGLVAAARALSGDAW
jgi:hypothetical protein